MKAIDRLVASGLTTSQIADAVGVSPHAVRFWARDLRSPRHDAREKLIALAESRGVLLLASDFTMNKQVRSG